MLKTTYGLSSEVRTNPDGTVAHWGVYGWYSTPLDDPKEPLRTYSYYGWRGSQRFPFGKAFISLYEYGD